MKVVGFNQFKTKKRTKKIKIFCIGNMFRNLMIFFSVSIGLMLLGIINTGFTSSLKSCIQNFVSSMGNIKAFILNILGM